MSAPASVTLIDEFLDLINHETAHPYKFTFSLLLICVEWGKDDIDIPELRTMFPIIIFNKGRESFAAINERAYHAPGHNAFASYLKGIFDINYAKSKYYAVYKNINDLYDRYVTADLVTLSEDELLNILRDATNALSTLVCYTLYIETFDYDIALSVLGNDKKEFLDDVWQQATHPYFMSFDVRRTQDLVHAIQTTASEDEHIKKVMYIFTDYYKPKSRTDVVQEINATKEKLQNDPTLVSTLLEKQEIESETYKNWFGTLNSEQQKFVDYAQHVMQERDTRKDPIAKSQVLMFDTVCALMHRATIDPAHAVNVLAYEALRGVEWLKEHKHEIEQRVNGVTCLFRSNEDFTIELSHYEASCDEYTKKSHLDKKESVIKGQSACKGKVTGKARVIYDVVNSHFEQDEILVTSMTRPEFVPLMKLAGGIVTNEGGITCHAAIVSRELNIPCVIGTKYATEYIQTGDMVEVDANTGIVTIL